MTIGKKLYMNSESSSAWCGAVSGEPAGGTKRARREGRSHGLDGTRRCNRRGAISNDAEPPLLSNYLLSGDTGSGADERRLAHARRKTATGKSLANSEQERTALTKVEQLEQPGQEFAQPLIDKRKDVDSATLPSRNCRLLPQKTLRRGEEFHRRARCGGWRERKLVELRRKSDETPALIRSLPQSSARCSLSPGRRYRLPHRQVDH